MTANLLAGETSPYLLQHKDNPVHWRPWGHQALAEARRRNKPILLSIGYSACHWCHVMAHESFEHEATAALMNENFVNIKVDREERPDIDAIYQTALALLGEHGGWPLTMFLTPEGKPFWGGTYFPPTRLFGRPALADVLAGVTDAFDRKRDQVANTATSLTDAIAKQSRQPAGNDLTPDRLEHAASAALGLVDPVRGGTSGAPKFPQPALFRFLWRAFRRTGSPRFRDAVTVTLDGMCQGGIYDHLGGGFARYATDDAWLVPHFEKMLYDNAQLVELLTEAWQTTQKPLYAARLRHTIGWALAEMRLAGGAFASALDADSEGVEGKYYVWSAEQIDAVLGPEAASFKQAYDVTPEGNWEGHTILNRSHAGDETEAEAALAGCRERLLEVRRGRVPPGRDDKVLADCNGLMIAALARAGAVFAEPAWGAAAEATFAFVGTHMSDGERLLHSWCAGRAGHVAVLDDYAQMARAALVLFEVSGQRSYLDRARAWVGVLDRLYRDGEGGGYFFTSEDADDVIARAKTAHDGATPSGNGTMVEVLTRLFYLTGETAWRDRAAEIVGALAGESPDRLINQPSLLAGFELAQRAQQVVVIGASGEAATGALLGAARTAAAPLAVVLHLEPGGEAPPGHPAAGKDQLGGVPTAYVCEGQTCDLPITDAAALGNRLSAPAPGQPNHRPPGG